MFLIPTSDSSTSGKVRHYTIMHEHTPVLEFDRETECVTVHHAEFLPFGLRRKTAPSSVAVFEWLTNRIDHLNRTYMNAVYIARKVGRDRDKVIKDSSGISFTDNFWIKTRDSVASWEELKRLRDANIALNKVALTGALSDDADVLNGFTSLFTTKGYFPKAVLGGYLYKRREDALLEYPAYLIAKRLGIRAAKASLDGDYVKIALFTDENTSLVHASELKQFFDTDQEIYNLFARKEASAVSQKIVGELQRMYIFNYLIANPDLHDDNYGVLYDPKTFSFLSLAPCFDHNVAFMEGFLGLSRTTMGNSASLPLDALAARFLPYHPDIAKRLAVLKTDDLKEYLSERQLYELKERISWLLFHATHSLE